MVTSGRTDNKAMEDFWGDIIEENLVVNINVTDDDVLVKIDGTSLRKNG
jgi:hypothetical protein